MNAIGVFADLLKNRISPFLREKGFRGSRQLFIGQFGQNWGMVQFQKSAYGTKDAVRFTINVGVCSNRLRSFFRPGRVGSPKSVYECHWYERVGWLLPEHQDTWWDVTAMTTPDDFAESIKHILSDIAIPTIMKFCADENLRDLWMNKLHTATLESDRLMYLSVLFKAIGPKELLQPALDELVVLRKNDVIAREHVEALGKKMSG